MINNEEKLLKFMSNFYNISETKLLEKYTFSQLQAAYAEIEHKTNYQQYLDSKKNLNSEYLMKEFSPL